MKSKLKILFIITGAKFYLDWLLITNPISKNPIIKFLWGWMKLAYTGTLYKHRFVLAIILFSIHLFLFIIGFLEINYNFLWEMLYNVYPMIIQIYIGYRCWCVIKWKKYRKYVNYR